MLVVGTTGSGKSTVAAALAERLGLVHVELDALYHQPGWTPAPPAAFRDAVGSAVAGERWVVDGNYGVVRDLTWARATGLVWLDLPLHSVLWQLVGRTTRRLWTRQELWNGNREHLRTHLSADGLLVWALKTHARNRREYGALTDAPTHAHLRVVRLRSGRSVRAWLAT